MNRRTIYILLAAAILAIGLCLLDRRHAPRSPTGPGPAAPASPSPGAGDGPAPAGSGSPVPAHEGASKLSGTPPGCARSNPEIAAASARPSAGPAAGEEL